jgi:hypothetical protein
MSLLPNADSYTSRTDRGDPKEMKKCGGVDGNTHDGTANKWQT